MHRSLLLAICVALTVFPVFAQDPLTENKSSRTGIAPFPIIAFNPDTNLILGFGSVIYRKPETAGLKTDDLTLTAYYSLKKQYCVAMMGSIYAHDDFFLIQPSIIVQKFPTDFYGIGPDTPESYKEKYTPVSAPLGLSVMVRVADKIYFGPSYDFRYNNVIKKEENKMLDSGTIVGSGKSISSGAGAICVIDFRDSGLNPSIGMYASISSLYYSSAIESDSTFSVSTADVRGYYTFRKITFGVQGVCTAATGDIPFYYYPSVGNDGIVRGYLSGRYIDRRFTRDSGRNPVSDLLTIQRNRFCRGR